MSKSSIASVPVGLIMRRRSRQRSSPGNRVIYVQGTPYSATMQRQTRAIPIVFVGVYHGQPPIWMMLQPM